MKGCEPGQGAPRGPVDFTGYWALVRTEGMDEFLKAAGFPWVVRKAALRFGGSAVDVIAHSGTSMRVTSLNAKGSWTRCYDTEREVSQRNAEGTVVRTSAWWEGRVFRSRMEGSELGVLESWRYVHGSTMAVRTCLRLAPRAAQAHAANGGAGSQAASPGAAGSPTQAAAGHGHAAQHAQQQGGQEAVMFWFFDRMETLQRHVAAGGVGGTLLQQIESDQRRVERATRTDTAYIQDVLLDWQRWQSPADEFIQLASPPPLSRAVHRKRRSLGSLSPASMSKSPSNDSLAALPAGLEMRSDARSMRSDSRSRLAESELSAAGVDRAARQAAALALGPPDGAAASPRSQAGGAHAGQQAAAGGRQGDEEGGYAREATLSYPRTSSGEIPVAEARRDGAAVDSLTFRPGGSAPRLEPEAAAPSSTSALMASPPSGLPHSLSGAGSDAATRGSLHGSMAGSGGLPSGPQHVRSASGGSAAQRSVHYKSMSAESVGRASTPGRASPRSTPAGHHAGGLTPAEQVMAFRLHEFGDSRGIASVVPVMSPNDTTEPQLLSMSPEQAEETAAKLRELEGDMMLRRQENRRGWSLCGCFVLTLASDTLPDHLRVWESRLT